MTGRAGIARKIAKVMLAGLVILLGLTALVAIAIAVVLFRSPDTNGTVISSGEERTYLLFVPTTYDPATPTPLVISIHGYMEWPAHQMQISGWNDLAEEYGFIEFTARIPLASAVGRKRRLLSQDSETVAQCWRETDGEGQTPVHTRTGKHSQEDA